MIFPNDFSNAAVVSRANLFFHADVDWSRYSYNAMLLEEFQSLHHWNALTSRETHGSCPFDNGQQVITTMGMDQTKEECFMILVVRYVAGFGLHDVGARNPGQRENSQASRIGCSWFVGGLARGPRGRVDPWFLERGNAPRTPTNKKLPTTNKSYNFIAES